ncbi:MAG TPA: hypothetical protein VIM28_03855 [Solirubrobacterales bacterium]
MSTKTKEAANPKAKAPAAKAKGTASPKAKAASSKAKAPAASNGAAKHKKRLRPGELDGLVLSYMCKHEGELPLTASAIGKGIEKSSGAVTNCLARLAKAKKVRLAKKTPRAYDLKGVTAR